MADGTGSQNQEELQKRMATLVAELQGVMTQLRPGNAAGGARAHDLVNASPAPFAPMSVTGSSVQQDQQEGFTRSPFSAFPIPGVSAGGPSHGSTLDQDLARLLPPEVGGGNPQFNGPMDQEKWMRQMLSSMSNGGMPPMMTPEFFSHVFPQTGGHAGGGGGAGSGGRRSGRGRYRDPHGGGGGGGGFPRPEFHPHGRSGQYGGGGGAAAYPSFDPSMFPSFGSSSEDGSSGGFLPPLDPEALAAMHAMFGQLQAMQNPGTASKHPSANTNNNNAHATTPPPQMVQSPTGQRPSAAGAPTTTAPFRPNLAAKPFRPLPSASQLGADIPDENTALMKEAFANYPLLQDIQGTLTGKQMHEPGSESDEDGGQHHNNNNGAGAQGGAPRKRRGRRGGGSSQGPQVTDEDLMDATMPMAYVEFKRQKIKKYPSSGVMQPGQYVIVDGDRGQDCGLLLQMTAPTNDGKLSILAMEGSILEDQKLKVERGRVIRVAEPNEVDRLHNEIASAERTALRACRQRCQELGLKIEVLDCEYQFDMKKVSFYFNSDRSVDFRDLVRDLYRNFGARIWMENINPNVKNVVPQGSGRGHH